MLYLVAFVLARRRPRMAVVIGALLAANALLMALALSIGRQLFVNELAGTVFGPASGVFYDTLLAYLQRGQQVLLWLGLGPGGRGLVRRLEPVRHRHTRPA